MQQSTQCSSTMLRAFYIIYFISSVLIGNVCAKAVFTLRVDNFTDVLNNSRRDLCYERVSVTASKRCAKSLHIYLLSGLLPLDNIPQLNNSDLKLGQHIVSLSTLPTEASITIDGPLPVSFTLVAELYQSTVTSGEALLARFVFGRGLNLTDEWQSVEPLAPNKIIAFSAQPLRLALRFRTRCKSAFYGPTCQVFCEPRDDFGGHYTCLPNGKRLCLPGWSGAYCQKPVCPGCHEKGGKCDAPGICVCHVGWHGANCSECQRYNGCDHGYCVEPNECHCNAGWVGRFCNHEQAACSRSPCRNGASCVDSADPESPVRYECRCTRGFTGQHCEQRVTTLRTTTTSSTVRPTTSTTTAAPVSCSPTDPTCRSNASIRAASSVEARVQPCFPSPCRNGATCVTPGMSDSTANQTFTCVCRPGYTGARCETLDFDPHLCRSQRNCFDEKRCAVRVGAHGVPQCVCVGDYVGNSCDVLNCTKQPCANDGHCVLDDGLCRCKTGYNGSHCEVEANSCHPNPCVNGFCDQVAGNAFCDCFSGWVGETCNISLFNTRFAAAGVQQEQFPLVSPALFWTVISVCAVLIVVLLIIAKILIGGIKKQRANAIAVNTPQLCIVGPTDDQLVLASVDRRRRLHAHLPRHIPTNNLNLTKEATETSAPCSKKMAPDDDSDACRSKLLSGTSASDSNTLFAGCSSKIGANNLFNPNVNAEKVLPSKIILSFSNTNTNTAEQQNHANAARLNSAPLPVRCVSPPNWNAHRAATLSQPSTIWSNPVSRSPSSSSIRHEDVFWLPGETAVESNAYRATGSSSSTTFH